MGFFDFLFKKKEPEATTPPAADPNAMNTGATPTPPANSPEGSPTPPGTQPPPPPTGTSGT